MVIYLNDDRAYLSWISHHRHGFVVDGKRKPAEGKVTLHRATCSRVKPHKRARLTSGAHLKACSLDADELEAWTVEQTGGGPTPCGECHPLEQEPHSEVERARHALTRLGREIVSYVLDLAVMYLDGEERRYHPSVEAVAVYLDKTPKQLAPALARLLEEGYLVSDPPAGEGDLPATAILYPTPRALRTLPAFDAMSEAELAAELQSLRPRDEGPADGSQRTRQRARGSRKAAGETMACSEVKCGKQDLNLHGILSH